MLSNLIGIQDVRLFYAGRQLRDQDCLADCLDISHSHLHLHTLHLSCSLEPCPSHQHQEENTANNQVEV